MTEAQLAAFATTQQLQLVVSYLERGQIDKAIEAVQRASKILDRLRVAPVKPC